MPSMRQDGVHGGGGGSCWEQVAQDLLQVRRLQQATGQVCCRTVYIAVDKYPVLLSSCVYPSSMSMEEHDHKLYCKSCGKKLYKQDRPVDMGTGEKAICVLTIAKHTSMHEHLVWSCGVELKLVM